MADRGKLVIISGPSGSGKSTALEEVFALTDNEYFSVSATTRKPRPGEVDGKNYLFKSRVEFLRMIDAGELLEYAEYAGNLYGTPAAPILRELEEGRDVYLDIEVQGAAQIRAKMPEAVTVFVVPPEFAELERRLRHRSTESEEVVQRRLSEARREYREAAKYDYIVVTDKKGDAAREIMSIVSAEKCKTENRLRFINID